MRQEDQGIKGAAEEDLAEDGIQRDEASGQHHPYKAGHLMEGAVKHRDTRWTPEWTTSRDVVVGLNCGICLLLNVQRWIASGLQDS